MSTYSTTLRIELIGAGQQDGTWGDTTNTNLGTVIEDAITGVQDITFADANYTLTAYNGLADEARNAVLVLGGTNTAQRNLIAPAVDKTYVIKNSTGANVSVTTNGAGANVVIQNGETISVFCDGTNFYKSSVVAGTGTGSLVYSVSPTLTGTPLAPTASPGTNTTQIATTAFVTAVASALGTMSTQNASSVAITGGTVSGITGSINSVTPGSNATGARTVSTGGPSGGSNGDIWYLV
jgi:hypothetical protein